MLLSINNQNISPEFKLIKMESGINGNKFTLTKTGGLNTLQFNNQKILYKPLIIKIKEDGYNLIEVK
ncbi:hypothetical protein CHI08_25570 [Peribacillus simplex]|nr:hypothetical protein CHI08_25570 [Peribacillus simplex]